MNFAKKMVALGMSVMMLGSLAACSSGADTKWVAKSGELTVPAGVYIDMLIGQYTAVASQLGADVKDPLKGELEGVPATDKMIEGAKKSLNQFIAVENKFAELKLTISDSERAMINQNAEQYWAMVEETYRANGVAKESFMMAFENSAKKSALFNSIYGEGGTEPVPESELKDKFTKDYAKIMLIPVSVNPTEDTDEAKAAAKQKAKEIVDKYAARAKAGEDMETLVYEAQKEISGDETMVKPEAGTSFKFMSRDSSAYDQAVTDKIFAAAVGEATVAETEDGIYLFKRYDITENPTDFDSRKATLTSQLRNDAFNERIEEWGGALTDVTYNDAALKRYVPQKLKIQ